MTFATPLTLSGPLRAPRQMLADQAYGGHSSIHDDAMAEKLGFRAGPIEGPTHFSLFPPLLAHLWGQAWFERGCLSAHYLNMVVEGEETRAFVEVPQAGELRARAWACVPPVPALPTCSIPQETCWPPPRKKRAKPIPPKGDPHGNPVWRTRANWCWSTWTTSGPCGT